MTGVQWLVSHGGDFATWLLGVAGSWLLVQIRKHLSDRALLLRAAAEVGAAVQEVAQVYVQALRESAKDGKLTAAEAGEAKRRALETIKANIGVKGLDRLGRILGATDITRWLTTRLETEVTATKPLGVPRPFRREESTVPKSPG